MMKLATLLEGLEFLQIDRLLLMLKVDQYLLKLFHMHLLGAL
jgi:hypothetical protein